MQLSTLTCTHFQELLELNKECKLPDLHIPLNSESPVHQCSQKDSSANGKQLPTQC